MKYQVVPAQVHHVQYIAKHLRDDDRRELEATSKSSAIIVLLQSLAISDVAWVALLDGLPCAIWGVSDLTHVSPGRGGAWLLGTDGMYKHKRDMLTLSHKYVREMHLWYPVLCNFVDKRNKRSCKWLELLGFKPLFQTTKHGIAEIPFIFYESKQYV